MPSFSSYDRVIHEIYEAALDPSRWDVALARMVTEFAPPEWEVAVLIWERIDKPAGRLIGNFGMVSIVQSIYLNLFAGRHEWSRRAFDLPVGAVVHTDELIPREEFMQGNFFKLLTSRFNHNVAIMGIVDAQQNDRLAIFCPGPPDLDTGPLREAITILMPHFQRAARLSRRIGEADMRAADAATLLDASPYPIFALGPDLRLLHANAAGEAALNKGQGLGHSNGRLQISDLAVQTSLIEMSHGLSADKTRMYAICDDLGSAHAYSALAIAEAQSIGLTREVSGATVMFIGGQSLAVTDEVLAQLQSGFGFTVAEARLAGHVLEGTGVEGYAQARGVSVSAARFLMRGIYEKTGINNIAALSAHLREAPLGWGRPSDRKVRRIVQ